MRLFPLILCTLFLFQNTNDVSQADSNDILNFKKAKNFYIEKNYKKTIEAINEIKNQTDIHLYIKAKSLFFLNDYDAALKCFEAISNNKYLDEFKNFYICEILSKLDNPDLLLQNILKNKFTIDILNTKINYLAAKSIKTNIDLKIDEFEKFLNNYKKLNYNWRIKSYFIDKSLEFDSITNLLNLYKQKNDYKKFLFWTLKIVKNNFKLHEKSFALQQIKKIFTPPKIENKSDLFIIGREFYYNGFYNDAKDYLSEVILRDGIDYKLKAYYFLALSYRDNYDKAIENARNGVIIFNSSNESLFYLAKVYIYFGKYNEALEILNKIILSNDKSYKYESYLEIIDIYQKLNDDKNELDFLRRTLKEYYNRKEICEKVYKKALLYFIEEKTSEAEELFKLLLKANFFNDKANFFLGIITKNKSHFSNYIKLADLDWFYIEALKFCDSEKLDSKISKNKAKEILFGKNYNSFLEDSDFKSFCYFATNGLYTEAEIFLKKIENKYKEKDEVYKALLNFTVEHNLLKYSLKFRYKLLGSFNLLDFPDDYKKFLCPLHYYEILIPIIEKYKIEPAIIYALIMQESFFDVESISPKGAAGLFQLMPDTAKFIISKSDLKLDEMSIFNPLKNAELGIWYFSKLLEKYENDYILTLAAYNAGEKRLDKWKKEFKYNSKYKFAFVELIPFSETKNYIKKCMLYYYVYKKYIFND